MGSDVTNHGRVPTLHIMPTEETWYTAEPVRITMEDGPPNDGIPRRRAVIEMGAGEPLLLDPYRSRIIIEADSTSGEMAPIEAAFDGPSPQARAQIILRFAETLAKRRDEISEANFQAIGANIDEPLETAITELVDAFLEWYPDGAPEA